MLTPNGVRDWVPDATEEAEWIMSQLKAVFESGQYRRIKTPSLEYWSVLRPGLSERMREAAITFFDADGTLVALRPDHTTPIARIVATQLIHETLPIRLFYMDSVFRKPRPERFEDVEILQAGVELIGAAESDGDFELIRLCVEGLKALGLQRFVVDIGHLSTMAMVTEAQKAALLAANYVAFGRLPQTEGEKVVQSVPEINALMQNVRREAWSSHVQFNPGLIKDTQYYTGLVFDVYVEGVGQVVGSGGRYDGLLAVYGAQRSAVGFALNVNRLGQALRHQKASRP
ncbi:MAG: ATP phosphoribosyltransferase regulatory subunit [Candidatus Margulisiibacteriota bacterium]